MDISKPNVSRIYDYVLGGHHNFEVDRQALQYILGFAPSYAIWARMNRWFLQTVSDQWAREGIKHIIDLGSGMPTQGHLHSNIPGAKVVYSDNDPITVAYAQEVLENNPDVLYIQSDVQHIETILQTADTFFQGERLVSIGFFGLSYFINDDTFTHIMQKTYEWAAPGSRMGISFAHAHVVDQKPQEHLSKMAAVMGEFYLRTPDEFRKLITPWQIIDLKPVTEWLQAEDLLTEEDRADAETEFYGAILART